MKKAHGLVHGVAQCNDCGWRNENYNNAQATAAMHARSKGHRVSYDVGYSGYYDGRKR